MFVSKGISAFFGSWLICPSLPTLARVEPQPPGSQFLRAGGGDVLGPGEKAAVLGGISRRVARLTP